MTIIENKAEQLIVAFKKVNLTIYEHPNGDLIIFASKCVGQDSEQLIPVITHNYEGVMAARVQGSDVRG